MHLKIILDIFKPRKNFLVVKKHLKDDGKKKKKLVETPGPISTELKIKEMNFQQRSI